MKISQRNYHKGRKASIATISAADPKIGALIAESLEKVGTNGVVTVEESKGLELDVEYKEGMELDKGYASPYFVTNPETLEAEIENPRILITDQKNFLNGGNSTSSGKLG